MMAELLDDPEFMLTALVVAVIVASYLLRWRYADRVVDARPVRSLGSFGELQAYLVSSPGRRRYVSLDYEVENDGQTEEHQVLFSARQAAALAAHLRVAAFPHASLVYARVAARRSKGGKVQA